MFLLIPINVLYAIKDGIKNEYTLGKKETTGYFLQHGAKPSIFMGKGGQCVF